MIDWIDCEVKKPPQNKSLLWCRATKDTVDTWSFYGIGVGKYRFGNVKTPAGLIWKLSKQIKIEGRKIFWAEFNDPEIESFREDDIPESISERLTKKQSRLTLEVSLADGKTKFWTVSGFVISDGKLIYWGDDGENKEVDIGQATLLSVVAGEEP